MKDETEVNEIVWERLDSNYSYPKIYTRTKSGSLQRGLTVLIDQKCINGAPWLRILCSYSLHIPLPSFEDLKTVKDAFCSNYKRVYAEIPEDGDFQLHLWCEPF